MATSENLSDPDSVIIEVTLDDGTETAFSFAEFLFYKGSYEHSVDETQWSSWVMWLRDKRDATARKNAWSQVAIMRRIHHQDPSIRKFRTYAKEKNITL